MQKNDRILPIDARLSLAHGRTTSSYHQSNSNAAADCSTLHERPSSDVARTPTIYVGRRQSQTDRSTSVETTRTVPFGNTKVNTNVDSKPRRKKLGMGDDGLKRILLSNSEFPMLAVHSKTIQPRAESILKSPVPWQRDGATPTMISAVACHMCTHDIRRT